MNHRRSLAVAGVLIVAVAGTASAWGIDGHRMVALAAVEGLPADMPGFFPHAARQLAYLGPEPDRWRDDSRTAMNEAWRYDHYIDLENVPPGALEAPDRFEYLEALYDAGLEEPEQNAGFLPYRILELYQRLVGGFARWRVEDNEEIRRWVQERIINDAGILGHYVADAANPHHTTIHFNGWSDEAPNPRRYTTSRNFHRQFETVFVAARIELDEVRAVVAPGAETVDARAAVVDFIRRTHGQVEPLYALEQVHGFDPDSAPAEVEAFVVLRLAAGARLLRSLWYSAWVESEAVAVDGLW
jgi:hypothetical protein